jgi:hypothetical protein
MSKKSSGFIGTFGGSPKSRLSNVLAGDRTGRGKTSTFSAVREGNYNRDPALGVPVTRTAVAQRKDQSRVRPGLLPGSIDIRGYFGDERTGVRKPTPGYVMGQKIATALTAKAAAKKMAPPAAVVRTTTNMKSSPAKAKAPARMAINRFTGSTLGFTSGKTTGSTVTKSGIAGKTTPASRAATRALDKGGVAGPSKTADGKNASFGFGGGKGGKKK